MEYLMLVFFLCAAISFLLQSRKQSKKLPPSPFSLPILGHLYLMKPPLHRTFHKLCQKHGPIIHLKLASKSFVVVSSPSLAEECFTDKDLVLANRPYDLLGKYLLYDSTILAAVKNGEHYRKLRRLSYETIFSPTCLNSFSDIRKGEVEALIGRLSCVSKLGFAQVTLRSIFMDLTSNIVLRAVAGKRYYGEHASENNNEAELFREIVEEVFRSSATSHPSDLFPILQLFDFDGYIKNLASVGKRMDEVLQKMVDEQRAGKKDGENNMIKRLLTLQETQPGRCTDEIIKGLILTMILGGTETTATALEWAMTNLLNHPEVLLKAKQELQLQVGEHRLVEEADLSKLHYLHCIILENLRLSPVAPLLIPHSASEDCTIGGYRLPCGAVVLVNAWAIQRDPELWEDPLSFKPERFENRNLEEYKNKMFPFGRGRRRCPGENLAFPVMGLVLSSLIQCFEWERVGENKIDVSEKLLLSMSKVEPLEVMCKARPILQKFL